MLEEIPHFLQMMKLMREKHLMKIVILILIVSGTVGIDFLFYILHSIIYVAVSML